MLAQDRSRPARPILAALLLVLIAAAGVGRAYAAPVPGFIEEWSDTTLHSWGGFSSQVAYSNPGTGGRQGAGDGFLIMSTTAASFNLGAFASGSDYDGDWLTAGIRSIRVWLNDVNGADPLEIHFVIGKGQNNVWQYDQGFVPPHDSWAEFVVDLTDSTKFTQIFFPGTFSQALRTVDRVHLRHDVAPYTLIPDAIQADVGVDHFEMSDVNVPVIPTTWGRLKALYR